MTVSFPTIIRDDVADAEARTRTLLAENGVDELRTSGPLLPARRPRSPRRSGRTRSSASRPSSSACRRRSTARRSTGWPRSAQLLGSVRVVALAGGTGGAKLAHGLQLALPAGDLTVVVNTGDDTERHGLLVMPDHDAILYMLDGRFDDERGWGIAGETWAVMDELERVRRGGLVPARRPRLRDAHRARRAAAGRRPR